MTLKAWGCRSSQLSSGHSQIGPLKVPGVLCWRICGGICGTTMWKLHLKISNLDKSHCLECWVAFSHAQGNWCCFIQSCLQSLENVLLIVVSITVNDAGKPALVSTMSLGYCWLWSPLSLFSSLHSGHQRKLWLKVYVFVCDLKTICTTETVFLSQSLYLFIFSLRGFCLLNWVFPFKCF